MQQQDLLVIENLEKSFTMHVSRREIHACRGISLHLAKGGIYRNHREERQWEIDDLKGDLPNQSAAEGKDIV